MGNTPSSRPWLFRRTRLQAITAIGGVVAILVVGGTLALAALNLHNVHASGTGGGGCASTGPVCTFKDHNGWADFQTNSDCVSSEVYVYVSDDFTRTSGTTTQGSWISLNTFSYNYCTGASSYGWGGDTATVQYSPSDNSLTAQGSIPVDMYTYTGGGTSAGLAGSGTGGGGGSTSTVTYTVNLTWKTFGAPNRSVSDFHFQSPGYVENGHYTGTSQNAITSGTLSDGTTNFAASPSTYGEWINADSGTWVMIEK